MTASRRRTGERGVALLLVLVLLVVVETAALLVALGVVADTRAARAEALRRRLDVMIDSSVAATVADFDRGGRSGVPPTALAGGVISSSTRPVGGVRWAIRARATRSGLARTVEVEIEPTPGGSWHIVAWRPVGFGPADPGPGEN